MIFFRIPKGALWGALGEPKTGSIGEDNLGDFCFFFPIVIVFFWVFGVYIIPKMANSGPWSYFLDDFRNFENLVKIWTPETSQQLPTCFKKYKKNMESSWKHILYVNLGLKKIEDFRKLYVLCTIRVVWGFSILCEDLSTYFENNFTNTRIEK